MVVVEQHDEFAQIMDFLIGEPGVGTLVIASAGAGNQVDQVMALNARTDKNVAFFWTSGRGDQTSLPKLKGAKIPIFYSPEKLARGLKALADYHAWRDGRATRAPGATPALTAVQEQAIAGLRALGRTSLSESEAKQVIAAWGIAGPREISTQSAGGAVEAAERLGYPVVLKIDTPDILHKTEAGVVRLGLANAERAPLECIRLSDLLEPLVDLFESLIDLLEPLADRFVRRVRQRY